MILTVDQLRDHVSSELAADALQRLIDSAEEAIVGRAGPPGARTEMVGGGGSFVALERPASAITSVSETWWSTTTALAADDYLVRPDGYLLQRIGTGTNPRWRWWGRVTIVYTPVDDTSTREEVQIALVKLSLSHNPGVTMEQIGAWTEQYANNASWNNDEEREAILCRLDSDIGMVVVGSLG